MKVKKTENFEKVEEDYLKKLEELKKFKNFVWSFFLILIQLTFVTIHGLLLKKPIIDVWDILVIIVNFVLLFIYIGEYWEKKKELMIKMKIKKYQNEIDENKEN